MQSGLIKNFRFLRSCLGHVLPGSLVRVALGKRYPDFKRTEFNICLEGFQRSGNTFFVALLQHWNPSCRIAHHTHLASTPLHALKLGVPTVILLRDPVDVSASIMSWDSRLQAGVVLTAYTLFYKMLWRKRNEVFIIRFSDATKHPAECIAAINRRFNLNLSFDVFTEATRSTVFEGIHNKDRALERNDHSSSLPNTTKEIANKEAATQVKDNLFLPMASRIYSRLEKLAAKVTMI